MNAWRIGSVRCGFFDWVVVAINGVIRAVGTSRSFGCRMSQLIGLDVMPEGNKLKAG